MTTKTNSASSRGAIWISAVVACVVIVAVTRAASAFPAFNNGTGGISFGVSGYGLPTPGVPTYIPNNFTLRNDILSSPGGPFLTANPILANNIRSSGIVGLPLAGFQIGGGNINGPFGVGNMVLTGTAYGFGLRDPVAGGGSASYEIGSMISTFNNAAAYNGPWGSYLAIGGRLPAVGAAGVVAMRSIVKSNVAGSPFINGIELPQLVLAASRNGPLLYSTVALGGAAGNNAVVQIGNSVLGTFRGLAINNMGNINIPAGDTFTVTSTLTAYADPSDLGMFDLADVTDLIPLTGTTIPEFVLFDNMQAPIPEPGTWALLIIGAALSIWSRRRRA